MLVFIDVSMVKSPCLTVLRPSVHWFNSDYSSETVFENYDRNLNKVNDL